MKTKIIIDSTTNVKKELLGKFCVVPLTVHFGEKEYTDGVTITHTDFYRMLSEKDVLPTTSQPTPAAFEKMYAQATADGSEAVVITVSSNLSGTYQSALIASENYGDKIVLVDSGSVAIGTGILAETALELALQGKSAQEIADHINSIKHKVKVFAVLDTLEYLKKGGQGFQNSCTCRRFA